MYEERDLENDYSGGNQHLDGGTHRLGHHLLYGLRAYSILNGVSIITNRTTARQITYAVVFMYIEGTISWKDVGNL